MSTPSGKPFDPNHAPGFTRRTGEQTTESPPEDEAGHSPYAPKRLRVVHSSDETDEAGEAGGEVPRFLFEANRPRPSDLARTAIGRGSDLRTGKDPAGERHPMDLDDLGHPLEPVGRPQASPSATAAPPAADSEQADEPDKDIERLEASLRWLRRQDSDLRQLRANRPLPPVEPRPPAPEEPTPLERMAERIRAKAMASRAQPAKPPQPKPLEPESLVPPALRRRALAEQKNAWRTPALAAAAIVAALPIAYLAMGLFTSPADHGPPVVAAEPPPAAELVPLPQFTLDMPEQPGTAPAEEPPVAREARALLPSSTTAGETIVARQPPAPKPPTAAAPPPAPVLASAPAPAPAPAAAPTITRRLDPAEIKMLVEQGEQFVAAGDLAAARLVFQRAAEAGDAGAAMALGATFDPTFLTKISVLGVSPDLDKARNWYQRAEQLGSQEAPRRLEMLANR
jgi:hypothetical protein